MGEHVRVGFSFDASLWKRLPGDCCRIFHHELLPEKEKQRQQFPGGEEDAHGDLLSQRCPLDLGCLRPSDLDYVQDDEWTLQPNHFQRGLFSPRPCFLVPSSSRNQKREEWICQSFPFFQIHNFWTVHSRLSHFLCWIRRWIWNVHNFSLWPPLHHDPNIHLRIQHWILRRPPQHLP